MAMLDAVARGAVSLSKTQAGVVSKLAEQQGRRLVRVPGGFWTVADVAVPPYGVPTWWVTIQTVRALEKKGVLVRTNEFPEEWRDTRVLAERRT